MQPHQITQLHGTNIVTAGPRVKYEIWVGHLLGIFTLQIADMADSHGIKIATSTIITND